MTIKECYEAVGSSYEDVCKRLGSERLIKKSAVLFLKDPSFQNLKESTEKSDAEASFRAAHTLKGVCLNLGFTALGEAASVLTEELRSGKELAVCGKWMEKVTEEYQKLIEVLQTMEA